MTSPSGILRVGTSGIVVPGAKTEFPEAFRTTSRLHYYATLFNTLEINSTFYKIPQPKTFEKWALDVPTDFLFTVKLWQGITHVKDLQFTLDDIQYFMASASCLNHTIGCVLIQFPASVTAKAIAQVEAILAALQKMDPSHKWLKAVEFRHPSWYEPIGYQLLDRYHASLVLHDMPRSTITTPNRQAAFIYLRFHGPAGDYKGSYSTEFLQRHADAVQVWLAEGRHVYVYFNNTIGDAFENAQTFRQLVAAG